MADASIVRSQWSKLSSARTLCLGGESTDDNNCDLSCASPLVREDVMRKSVDDVELSPAGIASIYKIGKKLGQ